MTIRTILTAGIILTIPILMSTATASVIKINVSDYGSARDNTADGAFDTLSSRLTAHAQVTNYLNIFTVTRGMLEFDISSITSPVDNASFDFYIIGSSGPNTSVSILGYEGDGFVELSDAYLGNKIVSQFDINSTTSSSYSVNVTDYINDSLSNNSQFTGFNLRITSEYTSSNYGYDNEIEIIGYDSGPFHAPVLDITTVPLPASIWMFLSGIPLLLGFVKRKNLTKTN